MLDTFTSLFSATIIFGILGNLAYENGSDDIQSVVAGDTGLAFVSYPNAISKFHTVPQLFSVLFFFMLFVLGIGSNVGMNTCLYTAIKDKFVHLAPWKIVIPVAIVQFFIGLMYVTPVCLHNCQFIQREELIINSPTHCHRAVNIYFDSWIFMECHSLHSSWVSLK